MSQVNITLNTNTVDINTTNNQIVVTDPINPNVVNITQPVTSIVEVITAGPQGSPGPSGSTGPSGSINTGSLLTTASFNAYTGSSTSQFAGTASYALTASFALNAGGTSINTGSFVTTSSFNSFTSSYNTGSFTGSFTGSLQGTASFAVSSSRAVTSSFAISSSQAISSSFAISASWAPSIIQTLQEVTNDGNNETTNNIVVKDSESKISLGTSIISFQDIDDGGDTLLRFENTSATSQEILIRGLGGTMALLSDVPTTGSLVTTSSFNAFTSSYNTGSFTGSFSGLITGSLFGTASFAISSSFATTSSFATSASFAPMRPGGSNTQIQYNSGSTLVGINSFTFNYQSQSLQQGESTIASGSYSHAQGNASVAIGPYSHAEGGGAQAIGTSSHAEGAGTIALGDFQHVQGQFNISSSARAAFIIGNGVGINTRSNLVFASSSTFQVTGSVIATQGFTGSLQGTASFATSASYALNGGVTQIVAGTNVTITNGGSGSVTINAAGSGGNIDTGSFATTGSNTFIGNQIITGSLNVTQGITGSLFGTASWAANAINSNTASYVLQAVSSSFAQTASYATTAGNGGVTKILAGANVNISPVNGLGDVTVTSFGTNLYNTATGSYGSFYDTGSVLAASATRIYSMSLSTTDISNGVFISSSNGDNTNIKFTNAGVYNIQFSAQFSNSDNSIQDVVIWVKKNGTDIVDSSGVVGVPAFKAGSNGQAIGGWNYYLNLSANDYVQLCWHVEQANVITLETIAAGTSPTHPRTPSLILTAQRVDTFLSNTGSFSGSFTGQFTGSLFGTSSWATNALTASYVQNAQSASYVLQAVSSSFATTASFALNAGTGGTSTGLVQAMTLGLQNIF
jgi:hypothetical protein